jgi:NAD-dependent dihydropyrimidine dehydrogenase PreA subunit
MKYLANVSSLEFFRENCTGCGRCIEVCPHLVFEIKEGKAAVVDSDLCMECGACANNCDFEALKINAGVGCASAIIKGMIYGGEPSCGCSGDSNSKGCC